jgi:hypothetical protein
VPSPPPRSNQGTVASPISASCGTATTLCNDNSYSCSQNRSGTCSQHSGVKSFICPGPICTSSEVRAPPTVPRDVVRRGEGRRQVGTGQGQRQSSGRQPQTSTECAKGRLCGTRERHGPVQGWQLRHSGVQARRVLRAWQRRQVDGRCEHDHAARASTAIDCVRAPSPVEHPASAGPASDPAPVDGPSSD